jgi:hypothetical protein
VNEHYRSRPLRKVSQHLGPVMRQAEPSRASALTAPPSGPSGQHFPGWRYPEGFQQRRKRPALSSRNDLMGAHL